MKRPVRITKIATHAYARKLAHALRSDFPDWMITISRQSAQSFTVSAIPREVTETDDSEAERGDCQMDSPALWPEPDPLPDRAPGKRVGYHFPARSQTD